MEDECSSLVSRQASGTSFINKKIVTGNLESKSFLPIQLKLSRKALTTFNKNYKNILFILQKL